MSVLAFAFEHDTEKEEERERERKTFFPFVWKQSRFTLPVIMLLRLLSGRHVGKKKYKVTLH